MDLLKQNESSSPLELQNLVPSFTAYKNENEDGRHSQLENFLRENMRAFWEERRAEIQNAADIRGQYPFPLARIRRIMKSNEKVERVGADATILIGKACEFFVMELTFQAGFYQQETKLRSLQHWDIGRAINSNKRVDFLSHIIRAHSLKEAMKNLKETLFSPAYPLQFPNINPPQELNPFKETDPHVGYLLDSLNMNPAFSLGNQEIPHPFQSTSSMPLKYHPSSKQEH